jgi:hypothetical protein
MELSIPEQIKQCEDIIENEAGGVCCLSIPCCDCFISNYSTGNCIELAKSKLKQLRGENMDIKEIERRLDTVRKCVLDVNDKLEKIEKDIKKEQEKEIELVEGNEYIMNDGRRGFIIRVVNDYIFMHQNGKKCHSTIGEPNSKEVMVEFLKNYGCKQTGRTLEDILKEKA